MAESKPGFSDERRSRNDNRKPRTSEATTTQSPPPTPRKETMGERWNAKQFSKTTIFWTCLGVMAATMLVGFTWGGWVTGGSAEETATTMADDAVMNRLGSICVAQFNQDPDKDAKLIELKETSSYQQKNFVRDQGWATMPGDEESDSKVSSACAKLLAQLDE